MNNLTTRTSEQRAILARIDAVEAEVMASIPEPVLIPRSLAVAIKEVLDETGRAAERIGGTAGRAQACAIFLDQCLEAQGEAA